MAIQTDKAEQSGNVMGLGGAGGRAAGEIEMEVGWDRIIKPLTRWMTGGFLFSSILAAIPEDVISITHFVAALVIYVVVMAYGGMLWRLLTTPRRT